MSWVGTDRKMGNVSFSVGGLFRLQRCSEWRPPTTRHASLRLYTGHSLALAYKSSFVKKRVTCTVYPSNQITQEPPASRQSSLPSPVAQDAAKSTDSNRRHVSGPAMILKRNPLTLYSKSRHKAKTYHTVVLLKTTKNSKIKIVSIPQASQYSTPTA